jgi:hypothetical protein
MAPVAMTTIVRDDFPRAAVVSGAATQVWSVSLQTERYILFI